MQYEYILYGYHVKSDLEFPQLVKWQDKGQEILGRADHPEIEICQGEVPQRVLDGSKAVKYQVGNPFSWLMNRTTWLWVEDGKRICYQKKPEGKVHYLQTYLLGFAMSMLLFQRGEVALHCSAVADERGAVLIAGESGMGKSTLTASFLDRGYRLMADDIAALRLCEGQALAYPAFPFQKLCRDAALDQGYDLEKLLYINEFKDKFLVPYQGDFPLEPVPIRALFILGRYRLEQDGMEQEPCQVMTLTGMDRFFGIANNLFLRKLLGQDRFQPQLGAVCLDLASVIPVYGLVRSFEHCTPEELARQAFQLLEEHGI